MIPNLPRVLIISPSLNQGQFLNDCLVSVASQDYSNLMHFVVDGGSKDNSQNILRNHKIETMTSFQFDYISENDNGQSNAINKGIARKSGNIIGWLNSDDRLLPGAISSIVKQFQTHPEIGFIYGDCEYINSQNIIIGEYPSQVFDPMSLVKSGINYIPQPACFFRRDLLENVSLGKNLWLREDFHFLMDYELWIRFSAISNGQYLPKKLAQLRLHSSAKSLKNLEFFAPEVLRLYDLIFSQPETNEKFNPIQTETFPNFQLRAADIFYWSGKYSPAFHHAAKSLSRYPFPRLALLTMLFSLLGTPVKNLRSRIWGNPYLLH